MPGDLTEGGGAAMVSQTPPRVEEEGAGVNAVGSGKHHDLA
jgi:hypothetical protein